MNDGLNLAIIITTFFMALPIARYVVKTKLHLFIEFNSGYLLKKAIGKKIKKKDLFENTVIKDFKAPCFSEKTLIENLMQEIKDHHDQLVNEFWKTESFIINEKKNFLARRKQNVELKNDLEFILKDFEKFIESELADPYLESNVLAAYKRNEELTFPAEVFYIKYIGNKMEEGKCVIQNLSRANSIILVNLLSLYCSHTLLKKGISLPYPSQRKRRLPKEEQTLIFLNKKDLDDVPAL